jgi:hypothetical protein
VDGGRLEARGYEDLHHPAPPGRPGDRDRGARSLTYLALRGIVAGEDAVREVSMAKRLATELDWKVADEALQLHGG